MINNANVELNSNHVNALIKAHILSDVEMRNLGFNDKLNNKWSYFRYVNFPKSPRYHNIEITFNLKIPKDGSDISIDVLDEDFCQPYDYQFMLSKDDKFPPAIIVRDFVEAEMKKLQDAGVLSGHIPGEYI